MKLRKYLLQGLLLLLCSMESLAATGTPQITMEQQKPQDPQKQAGQKPRMQTSAQDEDVVFKPQAESSATKKSTDKVAKTETKPVAKAKVTADEKIENRFIAVKTNLAYRIASLSNLAVEVQCNKHISVELPVTWSLWDVKREKAIRTVTVQPEGRWWLSEVGKGHFFGVHAHVGWFNVKWEESRYQDDKRPFVGGGISYGYLLPLSNHWGAEFTLGAGYAHINYETFYNIENGALIESDQIKNYWGITRVGLSLVYRF